MSACPRRPAGLDGGSDAVDQTGEGVSGGADPSQPGLHLTDRVVLVAERRGIETSVHLDDRGIPLSSDAVRRSERTELARVEGDLSEVPTQSDGSALGERGLRI